MDATWMIPAFVVIDPWMERLGHRIPRPPLKVERGGIRRQIVNRFRSTERTRRSVVIMITEGSRDTEDGMSRTSTERLLQQQIQTLQSAR